MSRIGESVKTWGESAFEAWAGGRFVWHLYPPGINLNPLRRTMHVMTRTFSPATWLLGPLLMVTLAGQAADTASSSPNLAAVAKPSSLFTSGDTTVEALNDGFAPRNSRDNRRGSYGNWPRVGGQWVQYDWSQPISTKQVEVYWWDDRQGVRLPAGCRLKYWNGAEFVPVQNASGLGVAGDRFNVTTFDEVTTTKLRLEMDSDAQFSTGVLEWRVLDSGKVAAVPAPRLCGHRPFSVHGKRENLLSGAVKSLKGESAAKVTWSKVSGPGEVTFADASLLNTTATFSGPRDYVLKLTATEGGLNGTSTLNVNVVAPPPADRLDVVYTKRYQVDSPLWSARTKAIIVNWIPHCIDYINRTNLTQGQGGIDNFIEAAKALRGEPHGSAQRLRVRQCLGASDHRVDLPGADGRSPGRRRNHQGAGAVESNHGGLDSEDPGGPGAGRLFADRLHAGRPRIVGRRNGRLETAAITKAMWPDISSSRRSTTTR